MLINRIFINLDLGRIMLYTVLLVQKRAVCVFAHIHTHVPKSFLIYIAGYIRSGAHPNRPRIYKINLRSFIQVHL